MKYKELTIRCECVICKSCGKQNLLYYLSDFSYGEKLLLTEKTESYIYLNIFNDPTYEEVKNILSLIEQKEISYESTLFKIAYQLTFDSINNEKVIFNDSIRHCTYCHSTNFNNILVKPEYTKIIKLPEITHYEWQKKTEQEKEKIIRSFSSLPGHRPVHIKGEPVAHRRA